MPNRTGTGIVVSARRGAARTSSASLIVVVVSKSRLSSEAGLRAVKLDRFVPSSLTIDVFADEPPALVVGGEFDVFGCDWFIDSFSETIDVEPGRLDVDRRGEPS